MQPPEPDGPFVKRDPSAPTDPVVFRSGEDPTGDQPGVDVGAFEQGTAFSRWAFARYLVGRVIAESVGDTLLIIGLVIVGLAAVCEWVLHSTVLAVLLVIVALGVFVIRWVIKSLLLRITSATVYQPFEDRLRTLVKDTHGDTLRELRRVGLPSHTITLPLLAIRLIGRRRAETMERLRMFEVDRAVPKARIDELHMVLRGGAGARPPRG